MALNQSESEESLYLQPEQVFSPAALKLLVQRIKSSGELGRSRIYGALLDYLLDCSLEGKAPKEFDIAAEVLGKGADYDVSRDSSVRVYIHQLRKKLDNYYATQEADAPHRIVIPRGQYALAATRVKGDEPGAVEQPRRWKQPAVLALALSIIILLAANLLLITFGNNAGSNPLQPLYRDSSIWGTILDDDLPIMLVMGDYYIFGELNDRGNIGRMVRDFNINSQDDLEDRHFSDWETTHNYQDLDLSYIPEGSAYALSRIIPILSASGKRFHVAMMSDLSTVDLRENHIIYIGYISALDKLSEMVFAASKLRVGRSYDELLNIQSGGYYTSDAGLPEEGQQFRDFGFFSTFPASSENQVIVIGGMRDPGLMYTALALSDPNSLAELELLQAEYSPSLEVLYEVYGMDRMHFDGRIAYRDSPDPTLKWRQDLSNSRN